MKLLTLDLGTTALKASLWSDGRLIDERAAVTGSQEVHPTDLIVSALSQDRG